MATERFCTFWINGELLGAPATRVQEIISHPQMTPIPLAPAAISGLTNLRGQIVLAIDMRRRLGIADRTFGLPPVHIVVRIGEQWISLVVDEIGDILEVAEEAWEHPPDTMPALVREVIGGVYKLPDRLLLALDIDRIASIDNLTNA
jgi:purine-binding chemotaxis protein CheW